MDLLKSHKFHNNLAGWMVFIFASAVYLMTIEPTASWWDCGEFIASSYKFEVGHPPGNPIFQLIGRFFSLFAFGDVSKVARMVNSMSAICGGFTVMFTFWIITFFGRKLFAKTKEMSLGTSLAIIGAGIVGSIGFLFSDSQWFSAVESEVYSMSAMLTATCFWLITKWEEDSDSKYHLRWVVLIAFVVGLALGVHLLNLLTIPAMTYLYYFKKFKFSVKGFIFTGILSLILLGSVQVGIISWSVKLAYLFEIFFTNSIGLPFHTGTIIYFIVLIGFLAGGIWLTRKMKKVVLNTIFLSYTFILLGYSAFFMLVIRANANTPINENCPKDAVSLLGYINRDQYGDWPLGYGQYYTAKVIDTEDGGSIYAPKKENGKDKYVVINNKITYKYDPENCGFFPRMWSDQSKHVNAYKEWTGIKGDRKPTFGENLDFFFRNQIGNQYLRYFMWNFVGRQNDFQGFGMDGNGNWDVWNGNWISGIKFIDEWRLGNQDKLPDKLTQNKGRNTMYFLPLILGLIGLVYQWRKSRKDAWVVFMLFLLMGAAIIIYLNVSPYQPRERDYAYAGSFWAFFIWIGLGVLAIFDLLKKYMSHVTSAILASVVCILLVPTIIGAQEWDDHDRSGKYGMRDFAVNYLNSCAPNAILITNGDNDTFPLWYAQEVEGIRTDVRVVNFTLASGDWYIKQLFNKLYNSDPLPFTIPSDKYTQGTNDFVPYYSEVAKGGVWDVKDAINFINSDKESAKVPLQNGKTVAFLPSKNLSLKVDSLKVLKNGTVPYSMADYIPKTIQWKVKKNTLYKNDLMMLDIIATNNWNRPIYFASPSSVSDFLDIEDYCYLEGAVYRFLPVKSDNKRGGGILADKSYDLMMHKFVYGNLANPKVYCDKESYGMALFTRNNVARVGQALITEGKKSEAIQLLDIGIAKFPDIQVPYDMYMIGYAELYLQAGAPEKGDAVLDRVADIYNQNLQFYLSLDQKRQRAFEEETGQAVQILKAIGEIADKYQQKKLSDKIKVLTQGFGQ